MKYCIFGLLFLTAFSLNAQMRVRSVHTGKEVVVRINDRGPYKHQRIIDLSRAAMVALGTLERGVTEVELLRE